MFVTAPNGAVTLAVGSHVGPWIIAGFLGSGGSASVYLASPASTAERPPTAQSPSPHVALRVCLPVDERHLKAIVSTYRATPKHDHVAAVHDVRIESINGHRHVVCITELADGPTLAEHLDQGSLSDDEARVLAVHLIEGLGAYHRGGLVHGDVKPANIMRFGSRWKLVDPAATEVSVADPDTSAAVSHERTLRYVPPEMLDTPGRTRRSGDVWAVGVTVHEAAAGESPFGSVADQVVAKASIARSVPADLATLIKACLVLDDRRPRTADELRQLPTVASARRHRMVAGSIAGLAIVGILGAATLRSADRADPSGGTSSLDHAVADADSAPLRSTPSTPVSSPAASTPTPTPTPTPNPASTSISISTPASISTSTPNSTATPPPTEPASPGDEVVHLDFESSGDVQRVVVSDNRSSPTITASASGGSVLEVQANNVSRRLGLLAETGSSPIRGGRSVTMAADVRLAYYRSDEWGAHGSAYGLVLKTLPDDGGAYVATVFPNNEGMTVRIGLISGPGDSTGFETYAYAKESDGHSSHAERLFFPQPFEIRSVITELGYWTFQATLMVEGANVQIVASLTSPSGEVSSLEWVDTGEGAFIGEGDIGLAVSGLWSIENRFDNLAVATR